MSARSTFSPLKDRKIPTLEVEVKKPEDIIEKTFDTPDQAVDHLLEKVEKKKQKPSLTRSSNLKKHFANKKSIEQPSPLQNEKKPHSTEFYVGLALGILIVCIGGYFIYGKVKKWYDSEDEYLKRLEAEGIENVKIN